MSKLTVIGTYVSPHPESILSSPRDELECDFAGAVGDRHYGITAKSNRRQLRFYPRGTEIRNRRQISIVCREELRIVADRLGIPYLCPEWLGANLLVEATSTFSQLAPGTRLLFPEGPGLVCEGVNQPCRLPAQVLQRTFPEIPGIVRAFVRQCRGYRGIVASVELPGTVRPGQAFDVFEPERHSYGVAEDA